MNDANPKPWGRILTLALGVVALLAGQAAALAVLTSWYGVDIARLPDLAADGVAVALIIIVSTPVQVALLWAFASRGGNNGAAQLGWVWPKRSEAIFAVLAAIAYIVIGDVTSAVMGRDLVTSFQTDIYRTADDAGWLPVLWIAVVIVTPIGEETLFRGWLFAGWLREPRDTWPVIIVTAGLFAILHVQYDWFVIAQVFVFGLLVGWIRWATGSAIVTMLMHAVINFEGMLETMIGLHR
jgi:membrane protease YdiL (CAAX protease family)